MHANPLIQWAEHCSVHFVFQLNCT